MTDQDYPDDEMPEEMESEDIYDYEDRVFASFGDQTVMETLGATLTAMGPGEVHIELPFDPRLTQQHGFLHAGIVTTVLDSACGYAAFTLMSEESEVLTVEFKSNFTAPAAGELFRFEGKVVKPGKTIFVTEGRAYGIAADGSEKLVSTMSATMMVVKGRDDLVTPPRSGSELG